MIDLHTHILPAVDDGALNVGVSKEQLEMLATQGVDKVVFTPHYYGMKRSPQEFIEARDVAFRLLEGAIPAGMKTYLGAEVHFTAQLAAENQSLALLSIAGSRYILTEFPFNSEWNDSLWHRLNEFVSDTGLTPIIAHVERYDETRKNPALLTKFRDAGCLLQVNTSAFLEPHTKNMAFAMLRHGMVDCLGTDTHDVGARAPDYSAAKQAIEAENCGDFFRLAEENMSLILADEPLPLRRVKPLKKLFGIWL